MKKILQKIDAIVVETTRTLCYIDDYISNYQPAIALFEKIKNTSSIEKVVSFCIGVPLYLIDIIICLELRVFLSILFFPLNLFLRFYSRPLIIFPHREWEIEKFRQNDNRRNIVQGTWQKEICRWGLGA